MTIAIRAYCNETEACIVWRAETRIAGCRGFAMDRDAVDAAGKESTETLDTWVGFQGETPAPAPGTTKPSTVWPIQRFLWRDFSAGKFARVRYRVRPMIGAAVSLQPADESTWSDWTPWMAVETGQTPGFEAHFNRGVVAAQWLSRWLAVPPAKEHAALAKAIADPSSPIRAFLGGGDLAAMKKLLADVKAAGQTVYAALYELDDPELIAALTALGPAANVLLGSGAFGPGKPDENAAVRAQLKGTTVHVFDRLVSGDHFAHNKFLVVCDASGSPLRVWTGSTNWSLTGLCTQANNGLLIDDADVAAGYLAYWRRLQTAGSAYPPALEQANATPVRTTVGSTDVTAWLCPVPHTIDLADAKALIDAAQDGIVFLMFVPGPTGTLLDDILALDRTKLFIHGVINQDPGGGVMPKVRLMARGTLLDADPEVILPAAIDQRLEYWQPELKQYSMAMVHSKVVIIDPFGDRPVVITGSHNMGPKASGKNDDNLVIIENAAGLAAEYAVNVMGVYDQYKWRYNQLVERQAAGSAGAAASTTAGAPAGTASTATAPAAPAGAAPAAGPAAAWSGLQDDDTWQDEFFSGAKAQELAFWFGEAASLAAPALAAPAPVGGSAPAGGSAAAPGAQAS